MSRKVILLVDDNANYRAVLKDRLEESGFSVIEASSTTEALQKFRHQRATHIHLALIDLHLPSQNEGLKLVQKLPIPSIIITADEQDARSVKRAFTGQKRPQNYCFKSDGVEAIVDVVNATIKALPNESARKHKSIFFILVSVLLAIGLYIAFITEHAQLFSVIVIGVIVEVIASLLLHYLHIT